MTAAICFNCGSDKFGALTACGQCGEAPRTDSELALSFALCEHLSSKSQLLHYAHEIKNRLRLTIAESMLIQAREALKDPQLMAMLDGSLQPAQLSTSETRKPQRAPTKIRIDQPTTTNRRPGTMKETALHQNAFWLLGATTRDDRRRIVEIAEEKSLHLDHELCQKARSDLTNPRTRLAVEMAWLTGVSPNKAEQLTRQLLKEPMSVRSESGIPTLAHANLMAAAFEGIDGQDSSEEVAEFILELAYLVDDLSPDDVLRDINEDRTISGFPEINGIDLVQSELASRKRYFRDAIKDALNRLPPDTIVATMTKAVDSATGGGEYHAPEIIDELVDSYEVEAQGFLPKEAENALKLIQATRDSAVSGERAVNPLIDKLELVTRNWDRVAQPIQLSAKARGIDHRPSHDLAFSIRSLAIDLFNEYDMLPQAKRITNMLQELFSELPELAEKVGEDTDALEGIFKNRKEAEAQRDEWAKEITYRTEIGMIFKDTLSISPEGVMWKNKSYPLDSITRVRWGGVSRSVNGIPTGTTYTIAFGDNRSEAVIELARQDVYTKFLDKLWRAVCVRLLTDLLGTLKAGKQIVFGDAVVTDDGVLLVKHKFIVANERVSCKWYQVHIWSAGGSFFIGAKEDKKTYTSLSYIYTPNVHILEQAIRMAFKKPGIHVLSDALS